MISNNSKSLKQAAKTMFASVTLILTGSCMWFELVLPPAEVAEIRVEISKASTASVGVSFVRGRLAIAHPDSFTFVTLRPKAYSSDGVELEGRRILISSQNEEIVATLSVDSAAAELGLDKKTAEQIFGNGYIVVPIDSGVTNLVLSSGKKDTTLSLRVSDVEEVSIQQPTTAPLLGSNENLSCLPVFIKKGGINYSLDGSKRITYTISNSTVASVVAITPTSKCHARGVYQGAQLALLSVGNTTITAELEGLTSQRTVSVTQAPVNSVTLSKTTSLLAITTPSGGLMQRDTITATLRDASGNILANRTITWVSANQSIASVDAGVVSAISRGATTITATSEGKSAVATITVDTIHTIEVTPKDAMAAGGGTAIQYTALARTITGQTFGRIAFTWTQSNISSSDGALSTTGLLTTQPRNSASNRKGLVVEATVPHPVSINTKKGSTTLEVLMKVPSAADSPKSCGTIASLRNYCDMAIERTSATAFSVRMSSLGTPHRIVVFRPGVVPNPAQPRATPPYFDNSACEAGVCTGLSGIGTWRVRVLNTSTFASTMQVYMTEP